MITVVTGPPCSGKSTYVADHRGPLDVVLDFDRLAHALGHPSEHVTADPEHIAVHYAQVAYTAVLSAIGNGNVPIDAWIINARPAGWMRAKLRDRGARFVDLDPGRAVCAERAQKRGDHALRAVADWYAADTTASRDW